MRKSIILAGGLLAVLAGPGLSSCHKTELEQVTNLGYLPPFSLPDSLAITYGQQVQLTLPAEYQGRTDVQLALSFRDNPRVKLTATDSLTAVLGRTITVDQAARRVSIDARQLYPTSTLSGTSGVRTPAHLSSHAHGHIQRRFSARKVAFCPAGTARATQHRGAEYNR